MRKNPLPSGSPPPDLGHPQAGAGLLGVIAMLGLTFALVQGTLYYQSKASAKFIGTEKAKILAQQVAEAGVEENIADLGSRKLRPTASMSGHPTYTGRAVGTGTYSSTLTTLGTGPEADTIELVSVGRVSSKSQGVRARLRIRRYVDTTLTPRMFVTPETTVVNRVVTTIRQDTVIIPPLDPSTVPAMNTTSAWNACLASADNKCDVCHVPPGNPDNAHVINLPKNGGSMRSHFTHHGCYLSTDGTCDLYKQRTQVNTSTHSAMVSDTTIRDRTVYDTLVSVDTAAKVQILSWK